MPLRSQLDALVELRSARFRHRRGRTSVFDRFFRLYAWVLAAMYFALFTATYITDRRLSPSGIAAVFTHGPAVIGLGVAGMIAIALRNGSRGGPLVIDANTVRHLLMAPLPRDVTLRAPALHQLRQLAVAALIVGLIVGRLLARRVPGGVVPWAAIDGAFAVGMAGVGLGVALYASGIRLSLLRANIASALLVGGSLWDLLRRTHISPLTNLGSGALAPIHPLALFLWLTIAGVMTHVGLRKVGGLCVEKVRVRSRFVWGQTAAMGAMDLRSVLLLRRSFVRELPRDRAWATLRADAGAYPVWRRGWHGTLRWPLAKVVRVGALGVLAGLALVGVWVGTTPLLFIAGAALFFAAIDAVEPLAQEQDHPSLRDSYPIVTGSLQVRHLGNPMVVMLLAGFAGLGAAFLLAPRGLTFAVGIATLVPSTLGAVVAAAFEMTRQPFGVEDLSRGQDVLAGSLLWRLASTPTWTVFGLLPVVAARSAVSQQHSPFAAALSTASMLVVVDALLLVWLRWRAAIGRMAARREQAIRNRIRSLLPIVRPNRSESASSVEPPAVRRSLRDVLPNAERSQIASMPEPVTLRHRGPIEGQQEPVVHAKRLRRDFGSLVALAPMDLDIFPGELVAVVGHNGAGKTTLLEIIAGMLEPSGGSVTVNGHEPGSLPARAATCYIPDTAVLYDDLTVNEHVEYVARLHGAEGWRERGAGLLSLLRLRERSDDLPFTFSHGMRQKASLTVGLIRPFDVLLIDEPFVGLDPQAQTVLTKLLQTISAEGSAVLVATHQLDFLAAASRCVLIQDGRTAYDGSPDREHLKALF